jgi:hypothetical protein
MRVACKHAHRLLETVYEGILISCSGGEVKLETERGWGSLFTVRGWRFAVGLAVQGVELGYGSAIEWD